MHRKSAISSLFRFARRNRSQALGRASAKSSRAVIESMESRQLLSITPSLVPVTISAAAITADSQLANYKTFDLTVTLSSGDDWASGDLKFTLSGGTFYSVNPDADTPQKTQFASKPNFQFDTFVSSPNFTSPIVLGHSYLSTGTGDAVFTSTSIDAAWGDLNNNGAGTFTIARLTVKNGSTATVQGRVASVANPNNPTTFSFALNASGGTTGSISGTVFNDANGNAAQDGGEAGLSARTVFIDKNNNSALDAGEASAATNAGGLYSLSGLVAGTYTVREIIPAGWAQTLPAGNGAISVTLTTGQNSAGKNFGTKQNSVPTGGSIAGTIYNDTNGNGKLDAGEAGISGRTVYIDLDNDNALDANETRVTTNASGLYTLSNLNAGSYKVRQVFVTGWTQTFPTNLFGIGVTLAANQNLAGQNFFTKQNSTPTGGSISGTIYNDLNGNGKLDSGETGISGRTVYIDLDNDNALDANETRVTTNASGLYTLANLNAGTYKVRQVFVTGWTQTFPTNLFGIGVTLAANQNLAGQNFFTKQNTGGNTASIAGNLFHDFDRDGVKDSGDTGLSGWTVYLDVDNDSVLDANETRVTTDASGNYKFSSLAAGTYKIRIVRMTGYVQTIPTNNFGNNATLSAGQAATNLNFGADN